MMARAIKYLPVFFFALLAACAPTEATPEQIEYVARTKAQMIGMSRDETFTCLGLPAKTSATGGVETLSYNFGSCVVDLTIAPDDSVKYVQYSLVPPARDAKPPDNPPILEEQCAKVPEVVSCTRWLRN